MRRCWHHTRPRITNRTMNTFIKALLTIIILATAGSLAGIAISGMNSNAEMQKTFEAALVGCAAAIGAIAVISIMQIIWMKK